MEKLLQYAVAAFATGTDQNQPEPTGADRNRTGTARLYKGQPVGRQLVKSYELEIKS